MPSQCPHCRALLPAESPLCPACARTTEESPQPVSARTGAWLAIKAPDGTRAEFPLPELTRIGRHPHSTLRLLDCEVSKEHAEISRRGGEWWVEDLNSSNGTLVNGKPVTRQRLSDGDELAMGVTSAVFHCPAPASGEPLGGGVTLVQSLDAQVVASVRAEDGESSPACFRPEREISDVADLRRDYEKLRIANELHRQVGLERDLATVHEKILKVACDLLRADNGVILLRDAVQDELRTVAVERRRGGEVMLSQTLLDQVVEAREGVLTKDAIVDARFSAAASIVTQNIRSAMAVDRARPQELGDRTAHALRLPLEATLSRPAHQTAGTGIDRPLGRGMTLTHYRAAAPFTKGRRPEQDKSHSHWLGLFTSWPLLLTGDAIRLLRHPVQTEMFSNAVPQRCRRCGSLGES